MFERFTQRARHSIVLAQEEARALQHNYIGTEHLLLGLLREEEGIAARVLESLDITLQAVRGGVLRIVGSGEEETREHIPFTPRAKQVLELSLRESQLFGHNYIGTEHLLLGLVREGEGVAARILIDLDADMDRVRNEVIRMLSGPHGRGSSISATRSAPITPIDSAWLEGLAPVLQRLSTEIRRELHREPDLGDLLVVLACARDTLAGRTLHELGVEAQDVKLVAERIRDQSGRALAPDVLQEVRRQLGLPAPPGPEESL